MELEAVYFCTFFLSFNFQTYEFHGKNLLSISIVKSITVRRRVQKKRCLGNFVMKCLISIRVRSQAISKALLINHANWGGWASGWSVLMRRKKKFRSLLRLFIPEWSVFMFHELVKWIQSFIKTEEKICFNEFHSWIFHLSRSLFFCLFYTSFHHRTSWVVFVHEYVIITFRVDTNFFHSTYDSNSFIFNIQNFTFFSGNFIIEQTFDKGKESICWRMYVVTLCPTNNSWR